MDMEDNRKKDWDINDIRGRSFELLVFLLIFLTVIVLVISVIPSGDPYLDILGGSNLICFLFLWGMIVFQDSNLDGNVHPAGRPLWHLLIIMFYTLSFLVIEYHEFYDFFANMETSVFFWIFLSLQGAPLFLFQTIQMIYAWKNRKDRISMNVESLSKALPIQDVIDSKHEPLPQTHVGIYSGEPMGISTYGILTLIIHTASMIIINCGVVMSGKIVENQYRDNSTFGLQLNNASSLDPWNMNDNGEHTIVSYALAVILMVLVYSHGIATKQKSLHVLVKVLAIEVLRNNVEYLLRSHDPFTYAVSSFYLLLTLVTIWKFKSLKGFLSWLFESRMKRNCAKQVAKLFSSKTPPKSYLSFRVRNNLENGSVQNQENTSIQVLGKSSSIKVLREWWEVVPRSRHSTKYFVIGGESNGDLPKTLTSFVKASKDQKLNNVTFWIDKAANANPEFYPSAASSCNRCLILLDEHLLHDPLSLLQLLAGLAVHKYDVDVYPCGKYMSIFSSGIDEQLMDWNIESIMTNESDDDIDGTNTNTPGQDLLNKVIGVMGSKRSFATVISRLRLIIEAKRNEIMQSSGRKFDFKNLLNVLQEQQHTDEQQITLEKTKTPLELDRKVVRLLETIGKGNFGEVRRGLYTSPDSTVPSIEVAVKTLRPGRENSGALEDLMSEAMVSAQLDHENIVKLVGVVTVGKPALLVMHMCSKGSFESYLKNECRASINVAEFSRDTIRDICAILYGIAKGMRYLVSCNYIHRDLASRNVLLTATKVPKISDFGLSRAFAQPTNGYYKMSEREGVSLPIRWLAPEILFQVPRRFTEMSDSWAFGIVCIEAFQPGVSPYHNLTDSELFELLQSGGIHPCPHFCPTKLYSEIISKCLSCEASDRMTFVDICVHLEQGLESGSIVDSITTRSRFKNRNDPRGVISQSYEEIMSNPLQDSKPPVSNNAIRSRFDNRNDITGVISQSYDEIMSNPLQQSKPRVSNNIIGEYSQYLYFSNSMRTWPKNDRQSQNPPQNLCINSNNSASLSLESHPVENSQFSSVQDHYTNVGNDNENNLDINNSASLNSETKTPFYNSQGYLSSIQVVSPQSTISNELLLSATSIEKVTNV